MTDPAGSPPRSTPDRPSLYTLPDDVLGMVFRQLELDELVKLRRVSKGTHERVTSLGFPLYLSSHRIAHRTLYPSSSDWPAESLVKYNHSIDRSLGHHLFHAAMVGPTWTQAVIPTLDLTSDQLVVGVGGRILVHPLLPPGGLESLDWGTAESPSKPARRGKGKVAHRAREYPLAKRSSGGRADVVGIVPLPPDVSGSGSGVSDLSAVVAQFDGTISRQTFPSIGPSQPRITAKYPLPLARAAQQGPAESIHTLVSSRSADRFMTTSVSGLVSVYATRSPWAEPTSIQLGSPRAWSTQLVTAHPTLPPTAFLGVSGGIDLHSLSPTGLSPKPSRRLLGPDQPLLSSPYDIQLPPESSSHHPSLVLSAWYDSHIRLHDLRSPSSNPVSTHMDPYTWADGSAFYSTAFVGQHHVAGGGARHGTVAIFDSRFAKRGWSCFSPGGKGSPVYKLQGDGGRLWGVTEKRAFVLTFDGSGHEPNGVISHELDEQTRSAAQQTGRNARAREVPSGWKGRGGKWGWTVRYDEHEGRAARGYRHSDSNVELFDSLPLA
ncbi:hypothetical protein IAU60_002005 [Kwoniella sp. DSM 27419]